MLRSSLARGLLRLAAVAALAGPLTPALPTPSSAQEYSCPGLRTCSKVRSCREAVHSWCVCGYRRADRDKDGVPCENVCGQSNAASLERIATIKAALGCR